MSRSSLRRTFDEIDALVAIYDRDVQIRGPHEDLRGLLLESSVHGEEEDSTAPLGPILESFELLSLSVFFQQPSSAGPAAADHSSASSRPQLEIVLPHEYLFDPSQLPLVWVEHAPPTFPHDRFAEIAQPQELVTEEPQEMLLTIVQWAADCLADCGTEQEQRADEEEGDEEDAADLALQLAMLQERDRFEGAWSDVVASSPSRRASSPGAPRSSKVQFGRRCLYSHHIRAESKRKAIQEWALQLNLSGMSKIGYPGIVVVEGPESGCEQYVNAVSRLRWKHFCVRGEEIMDVDVVGGGDLREAVEAAIDRERVLPKG